MNRLESLVFLSGSLFSPEWGRGNLDSIGSLKDWLTIGAVFIISLIGFIIVVASLSKLSINVLYTTFSKFWDKVYDAKRNAEGNWSSATGKDTGVVKRAQSIGQMLLCLFPNVKACSEFEDGTGNAVPLDTKAFFTKAVPACIFAIFIGYLTFAGYPLKAAEKFSTIGGEIIDTVLVNIDPVSTAKGLFKTFEKPDYTTDGSEDVYYKAVNSITKSAYTSYVGVFNDIKSDNRKQLGLDIEAWILNELSVYETLFRDGAHSYAYESIVVSIDPDLSVVNMSAPNADGVQTIAFKTSAAKWTTGSTIDATGKWLVVKVTFTPEAATKVVTTIDCEMTASGTVRGGDTVINATSTGAKFKTKAGIGSAVGYYNNSAIAIAVADSTITIDTAIQNGSVLTGVSGLYYYVDGTEHPITKITLANTTGVTFKAADSSLEVPSWTFGEAPLLKSESVEEDSMNATVSDESRSPMEEQVNSGL